MAPSGTYALDAAPTLAKYPAAGAFALHPGYRRSWIAPEAGRAKTLFFESDVNYQTVEIFSVPDLKLKGAVAGFDYPEGLCSDASGNVWVADVNRVVELSHTGKVLRSLQAYQGYADSCAVNPSNGDLAVSELMGYSYAGMVVIYKHASGEPAVLTCPNLGRYYFIGFDVRGNLYLDGFDYAQHFQLCRGTEKQATMSVVGVRGIVLNFPGMVQWYEPGHYLALGDQSCTGSGTSCIYKVSIKGDAGRVIGSTKLRNANGAPLCGFVQGAITPGRGANILGGEYVYGCSSEAPNVDRWSYPSGGAPAVQYENSDFVKAPIGAAISLRT